MVVAHVPIHWRRRRRLLHRLQLQLLLLMVMMMMIQRSLILVHQVTHEANVRHGQPECVDARQSLLIGERGDALPQSIKRRVQVVHAPSLAYVGCATLSNRGHSPARTPLALCHRMPVQRDLLASSRQGAVGGGGGEARVGHVFVGAADGRDFVGGCCRRWVQERVAEEGSLLPTRLTSWHRAVHAGRRRRRAMTMRRQVPGISCDGSGCSRSMRMVMVHRVVVQQRERRVRADGVRGKVMVVMVQVMVTQLLDRGCSRGSSCCSSRGRRSRR